MRGLFSSVIALGFAAVTINNLGWEKATSLLKEATEDTDVVDAAKEYTDDFVKLGEKSVRIISHPRENFAKGVARFETASRHFNPDVKGGGDYSKVYQIMDGSYWRKNLNYLANSEIEE